VDHKILNTAKGSYAKNHAKAVGVGRYLVFCSIKLISFVYTWDKRYQGIPEKSTCRESNHPNQSLIVLTHSFAF